MKLSPAHLESLHCLAVETAERVGAHIQSRVNTHSGPRKKAGGGDTIASQVVTEVDLESEALILEGLNSSIAEYDLGLLTEESEDNQSRLEKEAFWCIDPIDGTLPFTEGVPGYSVSIALVACDGTPLIGVVHDPVIESTYHAHKGSGAMKDGEPIPPHNENLANHLTWPMDRSMKASPHYPTVLVALEEFASRNGYDGLEILDQAGSVLNACWVTQKQPAIYFKFPKAARGGGSVWDFAATACLFSEWGMPATDIHGDRLDLNPDGSTFMNQKGVIYSSSRYLASFAQEIFLRL